MKKYIIISIVLLTMTVAYGQTTFQKIYGEGVGNSIQKTNDGGFIISGYTGYSMYGIHLIKIDSNGAWQWANIFGNGGCERYAYSVQQTNDDGYIISGTTTCSGAGNYDMYVIKTYSNGSVQWAKTFGGANDDYGYFATQTNDGGFIITGKTGSFGTPYDIYLVKTSSDGTMQWIKTIGGTNWEQGICIEQTNDGGFIILGCTNSFGSGNRDVYLVKTTLNGSLQWDKTFGGVNNDDGYFIQQTNDNGYIITGVTESFGAGGEDAYLIRTDSNGNLLWTRTFGSAASEGGYCVQQTHDRGFIITGKGFGGAYLVKTDSSGNLLWSKGYGGPMQSETGFSVQQANDNGFIIAGRTLSFAPTSSSVYVIKTDCNGNSGCYEFLPMTIQGSGGIQSIGGSIQDTGGITTNPFTPTNFGAIETSLCTTQGIDEFPQRYLINIYPNPFSMQATLWTDNLFKNANLTVYNSFGQFVKQIKNISGQTITLYRCNLPSGLYFLYLTEDNKILSIDKLLIIDK
jgi:hypothetical protein